jgi:anaerobic selenocysteine-containing dehydrogenase
MAQPDGAPKRSSAAGGWGALKSCGKHLFGSRAPLTGARALLKANQPDGFDCPGCAWGDPEHGSSFEFCENGVKAVSWEATDKRTPPSFFARHTLTELRGWSDYALEGEGRLTHPMRYDSASDRYLPVSWDEAFAEIGAALRGLDHPDQAEFYTSGRASNEAAYLYQLFARAYGTNNFPDCSNMCHEASGVALIRATPSASAKARSCWRISRRRTRSSASARIPAPTIRACSATCAGRPSAAPRSSC